MAHDLSALLGPLGVTTVAELARRVDRHTVGHWVRRGRLHRPYRGVVALPDAWEAWQTRAVAAVLATGGALCDPSALTAWRLAAPTDPVHVAVVPTHRALRCRGLVVHRVRGLEFDQLGPYSVTPLARAVVDSWARAHGTAGSPRAVEVARGAVITVSRDRRLRAPELWAEVQRWPALPGRRRLVELLSPVERGCQSELEIWGVREVLDGPGLPRFVQQHPVRTAAGVVHLAAAVPQLRLAVEMDGAACHGSAAARERDTWRDVALAALGWAVLRSSYRRLAREPDACRREILAVCRQRMAVLRQ